MPRAVFSLLRFLSCFRSRLSKMAISLLDFEVITKKKDIVEKPVKFRSILQQLQLSNVNLNKHKIGPKSRVTELLKITNVLFA